MFQVPGVDLNGGKVPGLKDKVLHVPQFEVEVKEIEGKDSIQANGIVQNGIIDDDKFR